MQSIPGRLHRLRYRAGNINWKVDELKKWTECRGRL